MGSGKHSSEESFSFDFSGIKKIKESISFVKILIIITIGFVIVGGVFAVKLFLENQEPNQEPTQDTVAAVTPKLENEYQGFEVLGKIKIDKLNVEQYILNSKESSALEKGVIKLYGDTLNGYGNFCIAGHNYENIFERLNELLVGDSFTIVDKDLKETEYEITEITSVEPEDLSVLLPNDEKIQITLITCENLATTRLVVKAEKK